MQKKKALISNLISLYIIDNDKGYHEVIELFEGVHEYLTAIEYLLDNYAAAMEFTKAKQIKDHIQRAFEVTFPEISRTLFRKRMSY